MYPGRGEGRAELVIVREPTFEDCGHCAASSRIPTRASSAEQAALPSAALGLIETPGGSVTVEALIWEGDGAMGLSAGGTLRSMSMPEAVSVCRVVGCANRLGL